jgi:transcriptional regulator with XRE-family HTH domain
MNEGENLKLFRKKRNLTQQELGEMMGVKKSTVSRWESGERAMTLENVRKASHALNVPINALLSDNDSYESPRNWDKENPPDDKQGKIAPKEESPADQSFEIVREEKGEFVSDKTRPSLPGIDDPEIIRVFEGLKEYDRLTPEDKEDVKDILKLALKIIEKRTVPDK